MPLRTVLLVLLVRISSSELATDYCLEDSALEYVRSSEYDNILSDSALKDDLKSALMHGWWTVAEELIQKGRDTGVSLTSVVYQGLHGYEVYQWNIINGTFPQPLPFSQCSRSGYVIVVYVPFASL